MKIMKKEFNLLSDALKRIFCYEKVFETGLFTFVIGFLLHSVIYTNLIYNHDSLNPPIIECDWLLSQGKWFVNPIAKLFGPLDVISNGILVGLIALSVVSIVLCGYFSVNEKLFRVIIGLCLVSFPSFTTEAMYHGTSSFCIAFLIAVIGAVLICSEGLLCSLIGVCLACLSLGSYQANISTVMVIIVSDLIIRIFSNQKSKDIILKLFKTLMATVIALLGYYIILKITLYKTGTVLIDYKGASNMTDNLSPFVLIKSAGRAYADMVRFFLRCDMAFYGYKYTILGLLFVISVVVCMVYLSHKSGALKKKSTIVWGLLLIALFPICVNAIGVLSANQSFYYISVQSFSLVYCIPVYLLSVIGSNDKKEKSFKVLYWILISLLFIICMRWTVQNNTVYQKAMMINRSYDIKISALLSDIHNTEGFNPDMEVVFVGEPPYTFLDTNGGLSYFEMVNTVNGYNLRTASDNIRVQESLNYLLENMGYITLNQISYTELPGDAIKIANEMPIYPSYGSIKVIDDKMIIKLSDNME